jgi:GGDEF domain-containing protein
VRIFDQIYPQDLDRRELQLALLACSTILVLSAGVVLLMYPVVFSRMNPLVNNPFGNIVLQNAFYGFCGLSVLLAVYIVDRQITILSLRRQIAEDRRRAVETKIQSSTELLNAIPNLGSFKDRLAMEFRRATASAQALTVLVVIAELPEEVSSTPLAISLLGDVATAISRKLRGEDSIYLLRAGSFGTILPAVTRAVAEKVSARVAEGLSDAAGASHCFSYTIRIVNYPEDASSAHELQESVFALLPAEDYMRSMAEETQ